MVPCPSDDQLAAIVDGVGLTAEKLAELHRHIADCPPCLALLTEVARAPTLAKTSPPSAEVEIRAHATRASVGTPAASLAWERIGNALGTQVGPYQLMRLLGRGAMGAVYLAWDTTLKRDVAIKFINAVSPGDETRQRFLREARAVARLRHDNVILLYGVGEDHDVPYQVSEYVDGQDLSRLPLPCPPEQVLRIALDLSAGLAAAHDKGVIHRDLKPSNVMLTEDGRAKLVDFGLARFLDASQDSQRAKTQEGALVGTPLYMAPETLRGQLATPQSDIFSLGLLRFELATGHLPQPGHGLTIPRNIDQRLGRCLRRCLDLDPARRFHNGAALHAALCGQRPGRRQTVALLCGGALLLSVGGYAAYLHRQVDGLKTIHTPAATSCAMTFMTKAYVVGCGVFQDFGRKYDIVHEVWQDPAATDHSGASPSKMEYILRAEGTTHFLHMDYVSSAYQSNIAFRGGQGDKALVMDVSKCRKMIWRLRATKNTPNVSVRLDFMDGSMWSYGPRLDQYSAQAVANKPNEWVDLEFDLNPDNWYPFLHDGLVPTKDKLEFTRQDKGDRIVSLVRLVFAPSQAESGALDVGSVRFTQ